MAINISEARVKQVTEVVNKLTTAFQPWNEINKEEDFVAILDQEVAWYDHGFFVIRIGHEAVLGLRKGFLHCNQPFKAVNKAIRITTDGAAVEQLWIGRCTNDIVRPDGVVIMKGSGREFKTHVGFFIQVSEAGKITRIDEYDNRYWDEGKSEEQYAKVGAVSSKHA